MNEIRTMLAPLGSVEPHSPLLEQPLDDQKLYKVMTVENYLKSITNNYLHFQRIDLYQDFPNADKTDGEQLPLDRVGNLNSKFEKNESYNAEIYYDDCRKRTYAYCVSLENSDYIWREYGNKEGSKGKVCIIFEFGKLRQILNETINDGALRYGKIQCRQIFSINYGIIKYIQRASHRLNHEYSPNPIQYTYLKEKEKYGQEKELRISLSTIGMGKIALGESQFLDFKPSLQLEFNFNLAVKSGAIIELLYNDPEVLSSLIESDLIIEASMKEKKVRHRLNF